MQIVIFAISILMFNIGVVKYDGNPLVCVDNGQVGACYDSSLTEISTYDCGPSGCEGF